MAGLSEEGHTVLRGRRAASFKDEHAICVVYSTQTPAGPTNARFEKQAKSRSMLYGVRSILGEVAVVETSAKSKRM
jgi:hypothetical protein